MAAGFPSAAGQGLGGDRRGLGGVVLEHKLRRVVGYVTEETPEVLQGWFWSKVGCASGQVDLAELDGPFVKLRLKGKFWHTRATVVARIGNYLKNRIPEILEVEIEDEDQLDDSPAAY
ncbi:hypothetical protein TRIUR3_09460 [Triticum urartu]|uniref:Uncharacterized protein n=1 Tax=Triticum urartu TaxID=4572 RepID=M7YX80_TRIUA|nr:hypothetical protein TRIUR3_09460 [Triticum urartu]